AAAYASVPISRYAVGAVALGLPHAGGPGNLYLGANFEFASQILGFTVHAEQSATNNAWAQGEHGIGILAVNAAPCGICRQFLNELTTHETLKVIVRKNVSSEDSYEAHTLPSLLPYAFGPGHLNVQGGL